MAMLYIGLVLTNLCLQMLNRLAGDWKESFLTQRQIYSSLSLSRTANCQWLASLVMAMRYMAIKTAARSASLHGVS